MKTVNPKQAKFVREYLIDCNGTQAAIRAGYSKKTANEQAARLLANASVKQAVAAAANKQADRLDLKADTVLRELLRIARCDVSEAFDEDGELLPIKDMPEDVRRAISSVDVEELHKNKKVVGVTRKVRFWSKTEALRDLGRHLKLFIDKIEVDVTDKLSARLAAARARVTEDLNKASK